MTSATSHAELDLPSAADGSERQVVDLLSEPRRRRVLRIVADRDQPLVLSELALEVVDRERAVDIEEVPADHLRSVHVRLYHVHAPMLADAGALEFDRSNRTVAPPEDRETFDLLLDALDALGGRS